MHPDFQVESRSYDQQYRGSWRGYRPDPSLQLSNEKTTGLSGDCLLLWLPSGTPMHWATRTRPLSNNCLQLYWPERWYTLSAFYQDRSLIHTYASIIQPAVIQRDRGALVKSCGKWSGPSVRLLRVRPLPDPLTSHPRTGVH